MKPLNNLDQAKDKMADLFDKVQDNFDILSEHGGGVDQSLQELENSKAEDTDLKALKSRVDNLVANPGTPTEGNAELLDIRVGADGKTYSTAGEAVRGQFDKSLKYLGFLSWNLSTGESTNSTDANNLRTNGWYQIYIHTSSYDIEAINFPKIINDKSGTLEIYRYNEEYVIQKVQTDTAFAFRQSKRGTWTDWVEFDPGATNNELLAIRVGVDGTKYDSAGEAVRSQINKVSNDSFRYLGFINNQFVTSGTKVDANELDTGWYHFYFNSADFDSLTLNFPAFLRNNSGVIQSYRYSDTYSSQLAWNHLGLGFRRSTSQGWSSWIIIDQTNLLTDSNIASITNNIMSQIKSSFRDVANPGLSAFESIVVIGDSLSVGYTQLRDGTIIRPDYKKSFPQYFVNKYGIKVYWGGSSGAGVLDILDNVDPTSPAAGFAKRGWDYIESLGRQSLYFIILGVNDAGMDSTPVGSSSDIGTTNRTFYGGLSQIIEKIHTLAPNSYVIVSSPVLSIPAAFMQALKDIADYYSDYTIFIDFSPYISDLSPMKIAGHYSQNGYFTAGAILDYLAGEAIKYNPKFIYINDANNDIEDKGIYPYQ